MKKNFRVIINGLPKNHIVHFWDVTGAIALYFTWIALVLGCRVSYLDFSQIDETRYIEIEL